MRLDVYVAAIDFVALVDEVVEHLPRGRVYLADQLQRGSNVDWLEHLLRSVAMPVQRVRRTVESGTGSGTGSGTK
jgi:hypothetical protein